MIELVARNGVVHNFLSGAGVYVTPDFTSFGLRLPLPKPVTEVVVGDLVSGVGRIVEVRSVTDVPEAPLLDEAREIACGRTARPPTAAHLRAVFAALDARS